MHGLSECCGQKKTPADAVDIRQSRRKRWPPHLAEAIMMDDEDGASPSSRQGYAFC